MLSLLFTFIVELDYLSSIFLISVVIFLPLFDSLYIIFLLYSFCNFYELLSYLCYLILSFSPLDS